MIAWLAFALGFLLVDLAHPFAREQVEMMAEQFDISTDLFFFLMVLYALFCTSPLAFCLYLATRSR